MRREEAEARFPGFSTTPKNKRQLKRFRAERRAANLQQFRENEHLRSGEIYRGLRGLLPVLQSEVPHLLEPVTKQHRIGRTAVYAAWDLYTDGQEHFFLTEDSHIGWADYDPVTGGLYLPTEVLPRVLPADRNAFPRDMRPPLALTPDHVEMNFLQQREGAFYKRHAVTWTEMAGSVNATLRDAGRPDIVIPTSA